VVSKIFQTGATTIQQLWKCEAPFPTVQTVNSRFYCDVLWQLLENVQRCCPELWQKQAWLLHHDNTLSHTSILTQQFLAKQKIAVTPHPPYSPDLAPCDFFLFPKMKLMLNRCRFDTTEIQAESQRVLDTDRKGFAGSISKMEETVRLVSTCRKELLRG
jgi:histone-lysine N-methyltransferase SETMAR